MELRDQRLKVQSYQYHFPYHYSPSVDEAGTIAIQRAHLLPAFEIERYWYLSQNGFLAKLFNFLLHNVFGIVLSGKWRRMIWRLHKRFAFYADAGNGRHLIAVAKPRTLNGGGSA
jgi:hypothetical protein